MGRFNRAVDASLQVVAPATTITPATTANTTAVQITSIKSGDLDLGLMINIESLTGTHDASNYIALQLQVSADNSTFDIVENIILNTSDDADTNVSGANLIPFNTRQIADVIAGAEYFRIYATRVGTTGTAVVFSAHIVEGV